MGRGNPASQAGKAMLLMSKVIIDEQVWLQFIDSLCASSMNEGFGLLKGGCACRR